MTHVDIRVLPMYMIFLAVHVLSGFVGMYGGLVPLFSHKGGRAHRKWGQVFTWALGISSLTSFPLAWWRSDLFQVVVGIFSGYLTLYGYRVLRRRPGASADKVDWALSVVCCIAFAVITLMSSYFLVVAPSPEARVALIFGCLGLIVAGRDLETLITKDNSFQRRVLDHMIASSLALMVAFSAFLNTQFGRLTHLEWSLDKKMLLPLLVAVPLLTYWLPRWSRTLSGAQSVGDLPRGGEGETPELARLRLFGWAEGVTFLLLLGIAVPLKHLGGHPEFVRIMGPIHGAMFVLYIVSVLIAASALRWSRKTTLTALVASVIPCGTFVLEARWRHAEAGQGLQERNPAA
jgi:integral membrane protein